MSEHEPQQFTLSILTESEPVALIRLTTTLARHRIGIVSMTSTWENSDIARHIVLVRARPESVRRSMKQIQAAVGVLAADWYPEGQTIDREVALYKLSLDGIRDPDAFRDLVRNGRARVLVRGEDYLIVERTGCGREIEAFCEALRPFGVMEFVRSGRVMVTKAGPAELTGVGASSGQRLNGG